MTDDRAAEQHRADQRRADDDADDRAALDEVAALRAAVAGHGLEPGTAGDPQPDEAAVAAAIARIVAVPRDGAPGPTLAPDATLPEDAPVPGGDVVELRPRHARRWWTAAAGVAAAAAAVAVGLSVLPGQDPAPAVALGSPPMLAYPLDPEQLAAGAGDPARDTLLDLAAAAADQDDPEPAGPVQHSLSQSWLMSTTDDGAGGSSTTIDPTVVESWIGEDGSWTMAEWRGAHLEADGRLGAPGTAPEDAVVDRLPAGQMDPDAVRDLPLDPAALRAELLEPLAGVGCGPDGDPASGAWCVYLAVTDLADRYVLPSALESAVWTVLAEEPGVTLAGEVTDRLGRRTVAVSVPAPASDPAPTVRVLLIDPGTGRLSGREEVTLSSPLLEITEPTVTLFRYTLASDWVAEVGGPGRG
ncbi:CU044_5270 family protein [Cellulomonas hominis]|uniref:CU044_5270 family protein n=1 Tax=Cellulomonas hominis TaxID=156981 RepID=UPI001B9A1CF1|nr:CU044_5270 family protein [Cellulomonas hominis]VTR77945.1 hypothetical protein CHMI_02721 [Cellulomonas hominis]